jgi:hypothetical protein
MTEDLQVMRAPRKAKAMLDRMVANREITEDGLRWLIGITDPFHDTSTEFTGFPDLNSSASVVSVYTETYNVTAPAITGTGNYDCQIIFIPSLPSGIGGAPNDLYTPILIDPTGVMTTTANGARLASGWNILTGAVGFDSLGTVGTNIVNLQANIPSTAIGGQYRLIASAVESVNVTPELYRGGAVTSWRAPNAQQEAILVSPNSTPGTVLVPGLAMNCPPTNQAEAQLYPNSKTWSAVEGVYQVASMCEDQNPYSLSQTGPNGFIIQAASNPEIVLSSPQPAWAALGPLGTLAGLGTYGGRSSMKLLPFSPCGHVYSGLNTNSSLQVTVKYVIERMPSTTEPSFLVLARNPTPYDPTAVEIYSRAVDMLPVAVTVGENPLGEWFNDVLDAVSEYAPAIGGMFGAPGKFMGEALGAGAKWMKGDRVVAAAKVANTPTVLQQADTVTGSNQQILALQNRVNQLQSQNKNKGGAGFQNPPGTGKRRNRGRGRGGGGRGRGRGQGRGPGRQLSKAQMAAFANF